MAKRKKSRKVGLIGVRKENWPERPPKREKTPNSSTSKGNKSGTRQQEGQVVQQQTTKVKVDPKIGSKKPIDLNAYKPGAKKKDVTTKKASKPVKYKTPQEELDAIENNAELEALLDKQTTSELSASEMAFVEKMTSRYQDLCALMGIEVDNSDDEIHQTAEEDDPFAKLDAIKLDDYKD